MENAEIASTLDEIADLLTIQEANQFRIRSYRDAARTVRDASERMADLVAEDQDLSDFPNIGESMAGKIHELVEKGTCRRLQQLREKSPEQLTDLLRIPGLGPKTARQLHRELGIKSIDDLRRAGEEQRLRNLDGLGAKTEKRLLEGIDNLEKHADRIRLKEAGEYMTTLARHLDAINEIDNWQVAGSFRRRMETVGDLDIVIQASNRERVAKELTRYKDVERVLGKGTDKVRLRLRNGLAVDFLFFNASQFGSALLYFTGAKAHSIALRKRARRRHWKLNERGLFRGNKRLAGKTEEEVYNKLKLPLIPPELREDRGELEAAEQDKLPTLVTLDDIRGDLHAHTTASDGNHSIEEMARAAKDHGYDYLAITDHSKAVHVANGLDEERVRHHADQIREVNSRIKNFRLLAGIEVDILKDGSLDLEHKVLEQLDWVNASVHSYFRLSKKDMTQRLLHAIKSGVIDCLSHPLGRQIGSREPIQLDLDKVFDACADNRVCLEINAYPDRLDLPDIHCRHARDAGVDLVISTDAHKTGDLDFMRFGVDVARRGWLEQKDIVNTTAPKTVQQHN